MALPWFKFFHEFAGDPKVQGMPEYLQRRLVMLFCFHAQGALEVMDDEHLARAMAITPKDLAETKRIFVKLGFINGTWLPKNWQKRQAYDVTAAERMRNWRRNQAEHERNADRNADRNGAVTDAEHVPSRVTGCSPPRGSSDDRLKNSEEETDVKTPVSSEEGDRLRAIPLPSFTSPEMSRKRANARQEPADGRSGKDREARGKATDLGSVAPREEGDGKTGRRQMR